jgi:ATP-dependent Clp protease ATP-binding subunit ClpC
MATRRCEVCGVRPASVAIRRIVPGEPPRIEYVCGVHAAEARVERSRLGGSPLGGGSLFDDFFGRFFEEGASDGVGRRSVVPERKAEQVDITQLFSDSTNELLQRAARQAAELGSTDLNTEHLLHAALEDEVVRRVLGEAAADPDQIRAQLEEDTEKEARNNVAPSLAPDAKRALLTAYEEAQTLDSSYIGPSMCFSRWPPTTRGRRAGCSRDSHFRTRSCAGRSCAGLTRAAKHANPRAPRPPWTSTAATLPRWPARESSIP